MELIGLLMITNQFGHSMTKKMESIWKSIFQETNFIVNAQFKYQTKINLSEDFGGSNWIYSIVNDSVIEKSKSTGGNTSYFYKTDKSYLDELLEFDECNY